MILSELRLYVRSFWPDWISRMSGIVSVALLTWSAFWNMRITREEVFIGAVLSYVLASFRVWQLESRLTTRIYADIIFDYLRTSHANIFTTAGLALRLNEPEKLVVRGFHRLKRLQIVRDNGDRGWLYVPANAMAIESQFRRLFPEKQESA